jgi:DNA modification methylase
MNAEYRVICGDSLELLPQFEDKEFDYFLTSPPFKEEEFGNDHYWPNIDFVLSELSRITSKAGFMFQSSQNLRAIILRYPDIHRVLIWAKAPSCSSFRWEPILTWQFNGFKLNKYLFKDVWIIPSIINNGGHRGGGNYENPIRLYRQLLQMLPKGRVIDPFVGTGTTLKVCRQLGHSCVGIEINPKAEVFEKGLSPYLEVAQK